MRFIPLTDEELKDLLKNAISEALAQFTLQSSVNQTKYFTTSELCNLLSVTEQTLINWRKAKRITGQKIGNKVYYSQATVDAIMNNRKS